MTEETTDIIEQKGIESDVTEDIAKADLIIDFTTSSAIGRVNIKFLAVYIPILWFGGFLASIFLYAYTANWHLDSENLLVWIPRILFLPVAFVGMWFLFIFGCLLISKFLLILVNLIHTPKEGIFKAEIGDTDFEFWCLRVELKKLALWLIRNCPLPWIDSLAFRWFGVKMDFSSHLNDTWCDVEFIKFGHNVTVGQGAVVMSSMVVGNYLIIKKVIFDDYTLIGGHATVAPGTIVGKDTMLGAMSNTIFNQILETGWIYFGIPARKLKPNKYAETRRGIIVKKDVDEETKFEVKHDVNIDEDKKHLVDNNKGD